LRRDTSEELSAGLASSGGVLTMLVGGLVMLGYFFAELTATNAVLIGVALAAAAVKLPGAIETRPKTATGVRLVACLVPLAVGHSHVGDAQNFPMARALIGGLLSSTVLTLVMLPTYYQISERMRRWRPWRLPRRALAALRRRREGRAGVPALGTGAASTGSSHS